MVNTKRHSWLQLIFRFFDRASGRSAVALTAALVRNSLGVEALEIECEIRFAILPVPVSGHWPLAEKLQEWKSFTFVGDVSLGIDGAILHGI
jgi:hypothetical protein